MKVNAKGWVEVVAFETKAELRPWNPVDTRYMHT